MSYVKLPAEDELLRQALIKWAGPNVVLSPIEAFEAGWRAAMSLTRPQEIRVTITAEMVSRLRDKTQDPLMLCKRALTKTNGNFEEAEMWLRTRSKWK